MLTADQAAKTFIAYGDIVQLFDYADGTIPPSQVPSEVMVEGPAGTGKTRGIGEFLKVYCRLNPKGRVLVMRETRTSLNTSFLPLWEEEVWGMDHPVILDGPRAPYRDSYEHPLLGAPVHLCGFDNPRKLYSSQWSLIYFCEMQETLQDKWESLNRGLRHQGAPFRLLLGDCNPEDEWHWANQRAIEGVLHRIRTRHNDNPILFDHDRYSELVGQGMDPGEAGQLSWTPFGEEYLTRLRETMSGHTLDRLFRGIWCAASGQVWKPWDPHVHHIVANVEREDDRFYLRVPAWDKDDEETGERIECRRELHKFFGAADIGHEEPGVGQVWALDADDRMYMVAEVYKTQHDHRQWADMWAELMEEFPIRFILTDHDHDYVSALNHKLRKHEQGRPIARFWSKTRGITNEKAGIDEARQRMKQRADGTRGLYLVRDCLRFGPDPELMAARQPWQTFMELGSYRYPEKIPGKVTPHGGEIPDPRCVDHGCDTLRGACTWARDHSKVSLASPQHFAPESLNAKLGLNEKFRKWGIPLPGQHPKR